MTIIVYCSGSIRKGPQDASKLCWSDLERAEVSRGAHPHVVRFLNPDDPVTDLTDAKALFGRDMYQIQCADVVVVDARERRGIGIGVEMLASRWLGTKLVAVAPLGSYYRKESLTFRGSTARDYVHPHMGALCDGVVDTFEDAGHWLAAHIADGPGRPSMVDAAIDQYKERLLPSDQPMLELLPVLGDR